MYIDTHCHLYEEYYDDLDLIIKSMGNNIAVVNATSMDNIKEVIKLINKYPNIYGTVGIHPEEVDNCTSEDIQVLEQYLENPKIIGIGEIGLDYYWRKDNIEKQKQILINQLDLAIQYNKPVIIHSRESLDDIYEILKKYPKLKINMHCFSGNVEMAHKFIELGALLGIGGTITFKNNNILVDVIKQVDLSNIIMETDSPFLTPVPFRGKRNDPTKIPLIAEKIAQIKEINVEEVYKTTTSNAIAQFDLHDVL